MREYLKRLTKGHFLYNDSKLSFATDSLSLQVVVDDMLNSSFVIKAVQPIKGVVWSDNERVVVKSRTFAGRDCEIEFQVNAKGLKCKDIISGTFEIVSNIGEARLAYEIKVVPAVFNTTCGEIAGVFNFAGLVQNAKEEAITIFYSEEFKSIVIGDDLLLDNLYDVFKSGSSVESAMEEFLIAAKKKAPVTIKLSELEKVYDDVTENVQESIGITKSGWGEVSISVTTDAEFVKPEFNIITSELFTGNHYELQYLLDVSKMHAGNNYCRIELATFNQKLVYEITAHCKKQERTLLEKRNADMGLVREYLAYRTKVKDTAAWITNSNQILDRIRGIDNDNVSYKLIQAQMCIAGQRIQEAEWLLDSAKTALGNIGSAKDVPSVELYCYYLYVNSLAIKDESYTAKVASIVKNYYENGYDTWRILWIMFYLDSTINRNLSIKLLRIKDVCHNGCTSPVMYMEALSILNSQPALLRVLNRFEMQVLYFGCKYKLISEKLAMQAVDIIEGEKHATKGMILLLGKINQLFENDVILGCVVTQMIRNGMVGKEFFSVYEKGILRGLRITQLYEHYIKCIDKSRLMRLPKMVLMYFTYESNLEYRDKAYLYANVITNELQSKDIIDAYIPSIEYFAHEQLRLGNIDDNLMIIYKHIWNEKLIDNSTYDNMRRLMFTYKVSCFDSKVTAVAVKHKEKDDIKQYPLIDGVTYIQIYTDNAAVSFVDEEGVYRKDSIQYEVAKVFEDDSLFMRINESYDTDTYVKMHMFENASKLKLDSEAMYNMVLELLKSPDINKKTKEKYNAWLIGYYSTFYVGDDFKLCYKRINDKGLDLESAVKLIEVCVTQEYYEQAKELVLRYGYSSVSPVKIFKLVRYLIDCFGETENELLTDMCTFVFNNKTYNEAVLDHLVLHYNGSNEQMYEVFKACQNFKVECQPLAERIVAQMLFTGEHNGRMTEVFGYYLAHGGRMDVVRAYVSYHSFLYFIKQKRTNDIVFKNLEQLIEDGVSLPDICGIALLKNYSAKVEELDESQLKLAQHLLDRLCKENKLFEFYKKFAGVLVMPHNMIDKTVIEYVANPDWKVTMHYYLNGSQDEVVEVLTSTAGVFTKTMTLFYGDSIQYYFVVDMDGKSVRTDMQSVASNNINPDHTDCRFEYINDMLASRELHDIVTMRKLMHGYLVQDYVVNELFKPM